MWPILTPTCLDTLSVLSLLYPACQHLACLIACLKSCVLSQKGSSFLEYKLLKIWGADFFRQYWSQPPCVTPATSRTLRNEDVHHIIWKIEVMDDGINPSSGKKTSSWSEKYQAPYWVLQAFKPAGVEPRAPSKIMKSTHTVVLNLRNNYSARGSRNVIHSYSC